MVMIGKSLLNRAESPSKPQTFEHFQVEKKKVLEVDISIVALVHYLTSLMKYLTVRQEEIDAFFGAAICPCNGLGL